MFRHRNSEKGASLVEFAFVAPFLILLLLGIVEFGYVFTEFNEIKHAAREGARYAAASNPDRNGDGTVNHLDVIDAVCDSLNLSANSNITITATDVGGGTGNKGELAAITVDATIEPLSGLSLIGVFLPDSLTSEVEFRLEQNRKWDPANLDGVGC